MVFYGKCSNCEKTYEKSKSELEIVDIKQVGIVVDCYYGMRCKCGNLIEFSNSKKR